MIKSQKYLKIIALIISLITFLSLFAQLSITIGTIPITGQTLAIGIIASIFSCRIGLATVLGYLCLGALGLPIFANQKSGFDAILGATGGFLVGFVFYVITVRACLSFSKKLITFIIANVLATIVTLIFGSAWLYISKDLAMMKVINIAMIPFIIPGIIKSTLSAIIGYSTMSYLRRSNK
ncbi:biotin transporter BioY [Wohlfahrtiimonas larvae]|uniref:Biotin transporter n=1 Tax=Wohlfahrtiimonas larvae TaxID=1157986 RepID=A0ABP9MWL6_9GAMM|nr:biotin transporter BioY [Wohlfahrtiimonas larvae]